MGRRVWVKVDPWDKSLVISALEGGADALMVPPGYEQEVKKLGVIPVIAPQGDIKPGEDFVEMEIRGREDEEEIVKRSKTHLVIVKTPDWTVIPFENLVARTQNIMAEVHSLEEAQLMAGILEKGVNNLLVHVPDASELRAILNLLKAEEEPLKLQEAEIEEIRPLGLGDRVCVDTCSNLKEGEGMLVGNTSQALFLVHAEVMENPYVEPRPFRVNAGCVHAYIKTPEGKTRYLSELKAGDQVLIADHTGRTKRAVVGRVKIEKRPLVLVKAKYEGQVFSTILQNAETIRLTTPEGKGRSIVELRRGDKVLLYLEEGARHFGHKISESIVER
jgi:3-dehydroquinate synthase II